MKIKAKKAFVSGRWSAGKGETLGVPAGRASRLIALKLAEPVKKARDSKKDDKKDDKNAQTSADSKEPPKDEA